MPCPKVLVVDDSRTVRTIVSRSLTSAGYEVTCATDGQEALSLLESVCPQLIVLDIEMPLMDGYDVCQAIQEMGPPWSLPTGHLPYKHLQPRVGITGHTNGCLHPQAHP